MTFKEYIAKRQARENAQGDFIRDCRDDKKMPDVDTWVELKSYLLRQRACGDAIDAAHLVWSAYQQRLKSK